MNIKLNPVLILALAISSSALAGSATWNVSPISDNWNTADNWTPKTVPNGSSDIATFASSNTTSISLAVVVNVSEIDFSAGASAYSITATPSTFSVVLNLDGAGIVNNSGVMQNFFAAPGTGSNFGEILFNNSASAGNASNTYTSLGNLSTDTTSPSFVQFLDSSTVGEATLVSGPGKEAGGQISFHGNSTAANSTIINQAGSDDPLTFGGVTRFDENASAGSARITSEAGPYIGQIYFYGSSTAANATIVCEGGAKTSGFGGVVAFYDDSTAGDGAFTINGGTVASAFGAALSISSSAGSGTFTINAATAATGRGATMDFENGSTGETSKITVNGGTIRQANGGQLTFTAGSNAGQAFATANGGQNGGPGAEIIFKGQSSGGTARFRVLGNAQLLLQSGNPFTVTIGSVEGDGLVSLDDGTLMTGGNSRSTPFSGSIFGAGGSLIKIGTGAFTLSGSSTYTGGTTVSDGSLIVSNATGSATGTGPVTIAQGTLGGGGIVAGSVAIGTGSGPGASLAPAAGTKKQATLTMQGALTCNADATYTCTFKGKRNLAKADLVVANGVTISNGAMIDLQGRVRGSLRPGLTLTLISNTSANPISGTFNDLPDGGTFSVGRNTFQANYEGGDGNDLTLTVVP